MLGWLAALPGRANGLLDKWLGSMFDVEVGHLDTDSERLCGCGRHVPCRHCPQ